MQYIATNVDDYISQLPKERIESFKKLRQTILDNLPKGFEEGITYGMIGYYVPHSVYPDGYHVNPEEPLPFMSIASQKNHIAFYHTGMYMNQELRSWFEGEYPKFSKRKLNMAKSCVRFKNAEDIPFELIGELVKKISVSDFIKKYEENLPKNKKK